MFDRISGRYDLMNHLMTAGLDIHWRKMVATKAASLEGRTTDKALDVATGTGDLAIALHKAGIPEVVGLDISEPMIDAAKRKGQGKSGIEFVVGDGMALPFDDASFDVATIGFGLRNLPDYAGGVREMSRVVRPGGRVMCLEMTPYRRPFLGIFYRAYFERIVPIAGGLIAGDYTSYKYLPQSVRQFPDAGTLAEQFSAAGLVDVTYQLLGFGAVALHVGTKH